MQLRTLLIASVLAVGATTPTLAADWDRIQSINFSTGPDRASVSADFGGRVEALRLTARESPMFCSRVTATFGNGNSRDIFSGRIAEGYSKTIDLPGGQRTIKRLTFHCHAAERGGGRLVLSANIGQYRNEWRNSPSWAHTWQRVFGNSWDQAVNYWVLVGHTTFTGRNDTDQMFGGWAGRSVTTIGLRPVNDDARCGKVRVTFGNGRTVSLDIDRGDYLQEDRTYKLDLPGGDRNVKQIVMKCRAVHGRSVTMNIYARK